MGGSRGIGNYSKPELSQEQSARRLDAPREVLALSTTLKELTDEIRRLNENLEDLNLDPAIEEGIEIARDLRTMLAGSLGYRVTSKFGNPHAEQ